MEYSSGKYKVGAVVVVYNPSEYLLGKCMASLVCQADKVCVVDNSAADNARLFAPYADKVRYIPLMENRGIAAAQNVGLRALAADGMEYVVFSDQDSVAGNDTVAALMKAYALLDGNGKKVGGVGTRAINVETGQPYRSKSMEYESASVGAGGSEARVTRCDSIRASISLMRLSTFAEIGGYDESLFIDGVDNEWCWRAGASGYEFYIAESATISHHLGEGDRKIAAHRISISSAFRIFFQYRNYIWLCRRSYVPMWWKRKNLVKYAVKLFYYPLFVSPRRQFLRRIFLGIKEGIMRKNSLKVYDISTVR